MGFWGLGVLGFGGLGVWGFGGLGVWGLGLAGLFWWLNEVRSKSCYKNCNQKEAMMLLFILVTGIHRCGSGILDTGIPK